MILGVDPGGRRIGIALADETTGVAVPLETIDAHVTDPVARIAALADEHAVGTVVVGRPVGLDGSAGAAVAAAAELVDALRARLAVPVVEHDERLTTVAAERALGAMLGRDRRGRVDAVAAQVMLQGYVDSRRR